ncbi:hypothetical protein F6W70_17020 [Microbacterium maritypicum]|uniref:Lipoprotein n=1 Tax=Microbacterium maritypicum TaxID=33918 RepID=A0AAD3X002_MICMQ|nr:hypothetical protein [Microbacterium liquefaciens]KAB1881563.1 hypothetical protein F6W70_17020 [Microbacterium liquefaciens]
MRNRSRLALASAAAALLGFSLTACAPASTDSTATPSPSSSPVASPSATPADRVVEISVDGLSIDDGPVLAYDDPDGAVAALTAAFGAAPTEAPVEGPYGSVYAGYDWQGTKATVRETRIDLVVSADAPGVIVRTPEGIGIGSTRAEAMAAGAVDGWDEDGDGVADYLSIGVREVPGTSSLVNPGEVGVEYIDLKVTGDVVSRLSTGGNDFSDI